MIKDYPDDFKFDKKIVLNLLVKHSEKIEGILKEELKHQENDDTYSLLQKAKSDTGVKKTIKNIDI